MATKNQIIKDITNHFRGHAYKDCYVGITSNIEKRLHDDHNVPRRGKGGTWIYRTAASNSDAREIEKHFLDAGMDGGGGGGDYKSKTVYAYKKIPYVTKQ